MNKKQGQGAILLLAFFVCCPVCRARATGWTDVPGNFPSSIGGIGAISALNKLWVFNYDAWSSSDGQAWIELPGEGYLGTGDVTDFKNKLWSLTYNGQVWSSDDGATWIQQASGAPWAPRDIFGLLPYADKLWILGGDSMRDVWSSPDGKNWTQVISTAPWVWRSHTFTFVYNNRIWLMGGYTVTGDPRDPQLGFYEDAWSTTDGCNWTPVTLPNPCPLFRTEQHLVVAANRVWVVDGAGTYDLWWTADFAKWIRAAPEYWLNYKCMTTATLGNSIYALGCVSGGGYSDSEVRLQVAGVPSLAIDVNGGSWRQVGEEFSLNLRASGIIGTATYQWAKDGADLPSQTTATCHIDDLALEDAGSYSCTVTDSGNIGPFTAGPVQILVFPAGSLPTGAFVVLTVTLALGLAGILKLAKSVRE